MSERSKILFVVEGRKRERQLVERLAEVFGFSAELYTVNGNIYSLYQAVEKDSYAEIVQVLLGMDNSESDKTILANKFTDIFLVFDCDPQHTMNRGRWKPSVPPGLRWAVRPHSPGSAAAPPHP